MPELPEVETVRRGLEPALVGRTVVAIHPAAFPGVMGPAGIDAARARLLGRRVDAVRRRGKYLLFDLDDGAGIVVHLRMTGVLTVAPPDSPHERFHHLTLALDDGHELRYADQRKFGRVLPASADDLAALDRDLGPEPLSPAFTAAALGAALVRRSAPIKAALLDQTVVAGIGNIYADEALFRSRIHPLSPARAIDEAGLRRLHRALREVLMTSLEHRGTTFSSYRDAAGDSGDNQSRLQVYGRGHRADPCLRCGRPLAVLTIAGRSSHHCPHCQPPPAP
jgi:formamidopyrimidine-DNA glycosylase